MLQKLPGTYRFEHPAMATVFEVIVAHPDRVYAEQAADAAFEELDRIEEEFSRYLENSDISRINNADVGQRIRVGLDTFECLQIALRMERETRGAFDIAVSAGSFENHANSEEAATDSSPFLLNKSKRTIELTRKGVRLDLGGIGKGYAVDRMGELLRDWEVDSALIHGGQSSVLALEAPTGEKGWPVTLTNPFGKHEIFDRLDLLNCAMGASGLRKGPHILDPRTGTVLEQKRAVWVCASSATVADALSTASMVMTLQEIDQYCKNRHKISALIVKAKNENNARQIFRFGRWPSAKNS